MLDYYKVIFFFLFFAFAQTSLLAQKGDEYSSVLRGTVKSKYTGEPIIGATIYFESLEKGTTTDLEGRFKIKVPNGKFKVRFSSVNMKREILILDIIKDKDIIVELKDETLNLDEVTVFAERRDANVKSLDMGKTELNIKRLNAIPSFMGEPDIIKGIMLLPGVSTVGEGASGYNVRGGSVDQNLIIQDGALIFNPSHVFGFFSVFNPLIVKNSTLYKSAIPAQYGGRLSSVLDVELKEASYQDYKIEGSVGMVSSKLAVQLPIIKDKLSVLVGGRGSYSDWLLQRSKNLDLQKSTANFYDFNAKAQYILNKNNKISYSGYYSGDQFNLASTTTYKWFTNNQVIDWIHSFNERLDMDVRYVYGQYNYDLENEDNLDSFTIKSNITYHNISVIYNYSLNENHKLNAGLSGYYYMFSPGTREPFGANSGWDFDKLEDEQSYEYSIFMEDEMKINDIISVKAGLRYNGFMNVGEGSDFIYTNGQPRQNKYITDTLYYTKGEKIASFGGFEPRLSVNYSINSNSSVKASYNRMRQNLHLISNTAASAPTDIWKTSNYYLEPEISDQYSLGYFRNFRDNVFETSVEIYYKKGSNIVEYKNGAELIMNQNVEADLVSGESMAYGIEFWVNKKIGKVNGWAGYTYSRSFRKVNGNFDDEIISDGDWYSSNIDKPHDFTLALTYKSSPLVDFGLNFVYNTGRPVTAPQLTYDLDLNTNIMSYSLRNQERIPDYHRLDLSMTVRSKPKVDRRWRMSWTLGVYNLYGRKNAYSVFYKNELNSPPGVYKLAVLGSAFPSLSINFEF